MKASQLLPALWMFVWAFAVVNLPGQEASDYRTFTSSDGKKIEARAIGSSGSSVKIEMRDGRSFELPVSRLSSEDQEWIAEWKKGAATDYVPSLKVSFDENLEESTDQSGFVYVEKFSPELVVTNEEEEFDLADAKATMLVIVEDVENKDVFVVLAKDTKTFSVAAGESETIKGKASETKYATIQAYGAKFAGYAVIIENSSGKIIAHDGSRNWDGNSESALKAQEGAKVNEDFEESK